MGNCSSGSQNTSFFILLKKFLPVVIAVCWLDLCLPAQTQSEARPRPPVTPEDLAMTDLPEFPGAPAVCLFYERIDDRKKDELSVFKRIKILTPAGRDYANLEIPYYSFLNEVKDIKVKVYEPGGTSREVKPEILEKVGSRLSQLEYRIKTLAIPDISPGQIIDYEYKVGPREDSPWIGMLGSLITIKIIINLVNLDAPDLFSQLGVSWDLQDSIYIRQARYRFVPDLFIGVARKDKYNLAWVANKLRNVKPIIDSGGLELELTDVLPFDKEEFMTPESNEKINFKVYYLDPSIKNSQTYWEKSAEAWRKDYEEYMAAEKALKKEVRTLVGSEIGAEARLRKIYERVQSIKNLNYAREMSENDWKKIKPNKNVADVLKRNYGFSRQIARTFAGLARTAGYETNLVRVVSRDDKFFNPSLPLFYGQFDSEIVMIKIDGRFQAFDPGLPDCPYGVVYWPRTGSTAIVFENKQMKFFTTPLSSADESTRRQLAKLRPDGQGNLAGAIRLEYTGQEALSRKFENREKDEIKVKEILEEELIKKLPPGSQVKLTSLTGLKDRTTELRAEFEATIAGVVHQAGDRLLLPVYVLTNPGRYPFRSAFRKYPIYFNYLFTEIDDLTIELPEGYEVEALPKARSRDSERSSFTLDCHQSEPSQLRIERRLAIKKNLFPADEYIHLKEFFDYVQARDGEQIILRKK